MNIIGAALGDRVDDAAGRTAIFRGVVGGVDLELLHGDLRRRVTGAGASALFREERLVVVGAVHGDIVQQGAHSAEADQTEAVGVADHTRRQQNEAGPASAVDGKVFNRGFVQCGSEVSGGDVDQWGLGGNIHLFGGADGEVRAHRSQAADRDNDVLCPVGGKSLGLDGYGIGRRFNWPTRK